ncbi:tyrosine-type recombinase/integrase [Luteolibacter sp. Populi]|uniref:tyrosine-type recombinase/integrase n=1 Tax=Luteolibacter sp. Populi TaxID=3230487 RepID=UPI0034656063
MASIYKRPEAATWQAQFYVKDPATGELRKVRKSTGHTNRKKALTAALELERNSQGVVQAGSDRAQRAKAVLAEAVAEIERETFTAPTARKYLAKLLEIATGEEMQAYSIQTWADEWLRRKERESSKATMARYQGHTKALLSWLGAERGKKPLESLTALDARKWRESLQDEGRAGKTVLAYMKDAGALYRAAIREGLVSFNPFTALEAIDTGDSLDRKPFTPAEVVGLLGSAPSEEWRGLILVAAFTGLRLGDAARLSWASVDLEAKRITLIPSKTKKKKREVRIPIQPDLLAFFEGVPIHSDKPDAPVFQKLSTVGVGARAGLSQAFNKVMQKAGVDRGKPSRVIAEGESTGKGRITYERGFHSLRHTFTTWLRTAGVSEEDRMALTGHSTRESHQIYSHADEAALRDAIAKLPSLTISKA